MIPIKEFADRRRRLLAQCQANSIVIVPATNLVTRSRDTEYPFRQDSYFWYLTGFSEPDALLVLSNKDEITYETMFVLPKDKHAEVWHGRRLGADAAPDSLHLDKAFSTDELEDVLPALLDGHAHLYFSLDYQQSSEALVFTAIEQCKSAPKNSMTAPPAIHDVNRMLDDMRVIKSENELQVMQTAASISANAHVRAMKISKQSQWEYQLEAEIMHEFATKGARFAAYNPIVGSGDNACILHYTENNDRLNDGELVLIDAGCEYLGYAADITRTFPVNGTFSDAQREIYQLVLDAQTASFDVIKAGATFSQAMNAAVKVISAGLAALGILKGRLDEILSKEQWREFLMHGIGHYLGLDVHDVGIYKQNNQDVPLRKGNVITIEPGIYISPDADVPEQYKGIGVRIEDNLVITDDGFINLTTAVPKTIEEIEALMK